MPFNTEGAAYIFGCHPTGVLAAPVIGQAIQLMPRGGVIQDRAGFPWVKPERGRVAGEWWSASFQPWMTHASDVRGPCRSIGTG